MPYTIFLWFMVVLSPVCGVIGCNSWFQMGYSFVPVPAKRRHLRSNFSLRRKSRPILHSRWCLEGKTNKSTYRYYLNKHKSYCVSSFGETQEPNNICVYQERLMTSFLSLCNKNDIIMHSWLRIYLLAKASRTTSMPFDPVEGFTGLFAPTPSKSPRSTTMEY